MRAAIGALVLGLAPWTSAAVPPAEDSAEAPVEIRLPEIEVNAAQSVTIQGRSESLRAVVEALCARAGVELRAYDALDRPVSARYTERPLAEVLERLLWQESFVLGTTEPAAGSTARIAWLSVLARGEAGAPPVRHTTKVRPLHENATERPVSLPRTAFVSPNASARRRALQVFNKRLLEDPDERLRFLNTPSDRLVETLRGHAFAEEFVNRLRVLQRDQYIRLKLDEIMEAIRR